MSTKFTEWTKQLGQQHFAMRENLGGLELSSGRTLCGMPMLGNNYAHALHDEDKTPCSQCAERMAFIAEGELV